MPQITNTFLKSKMNKDLDSRILPNGEYRDAQNLQISKSEGAEVGEFENIPGNTRLAYLYTGRNGSDYTGKIIGQCTDETNNNLYIMSAGYNGDGRCPRDLVVYADSTGVTDQTVIQLYDAAGNLLDPSVVGIELGMVLWGDSWNGVPSGEGGQGVDPIVTDINIANDKITLSQSVSFANTGVAQGDTINIGFNNTIHRYSIDDDTLTLLVRGAFLNFHQDFRIHAANLIDDLLFWTDNRNQPRKINVQSANPLLLTSPTHYVNEDQISVAKYYPYETPLVLHQTIREITGGVPEPAPGLGGFGKGYRLTMADTTNIQIGDIVTGFPGQLDTELWNVILINPGVSITIYNNFKSGTLGPPSQAPGTYNGTDTIPITFSNTTMKNSNDLRLSRGFSTTVSTAAGPVGAGNPINIVYNFFNTNSDQSPQPTPRVGDYIISDTLEITGSGAGQITLADEVIISEITDINPTSGPVGGVPARTLIFELTKDITIAAGTNDITVSPNPNYNVNFTGDPDLIEEKFVRFSYRFKYEDNEYSLAAPYTQICFIPQQDGYIGGGKPEQLQDMTNIYDSTVVEWFTNKIDTVSLKIPLPDVEVSARATTTTAGVVPAGTAIALTITTGTINVGDIVVSNTTGVTIPKGTTVTEVQPLQIKLSNNVTLVNPTDFEFSLSPTTSLINNYKVTDIEILYKESDGLSTKILETIPVTSTISSLVEEIPNTISGTGTQSYYNFDYKSIKPYRTLPTREQNRVYDNVPVKALAQEISANRVIYGNFLQGHTSPNNLNYEVFTADKSVAYNNYAQYPNHSVKQNRNYQAGFVLADRYGRSSSVILSSNDTDPTKNGSTIYVPYKTWNDVGGPTSNAVTGISPDNTTIYKWLGNVLRVRVNNGITQIKPNSTTGEPGLYKSQNDTSVDGLIIDGGGIGHVVGDIISTNYPTGNRAYGVGLTFEVTTVTGAGVITGVKIVNPGTGYADGQILFQVASTGAGTGAVVTTIVNDPNPTGWQSYKVVVKQQEQEYYNVYLPGFVSGYPVTLTTEYGRIGFAVLLGDNINKVPRDLSEVGPTQSEFSASVKLFGRVNNPNISNNQKGGAGVAYYENRIYPWNTQYFPGRINDEAVTVGNIGFGGLQLATSPFTQGTPSGSATQGAFNDADGDLPWGIPGNLQSFYNQEQNPIAMGLKIGAEESQPQLNLIASLGYDNELNTLGAKVTSTSWGSTMLVNTVGCMTPFLSVSETEPVESQLEIFYESSTSGNFVTLNTQVVNDYPGVSGTTTTTASFAENTASGSNIITAFSFTDASGNQLTLNGVPTITQVIDGNNTNVTGIFTIAQNGATPLDFDLITADTFVFAADSLSNTFQVSFETSYTSLGVTYVDTLTNQITVNLTNTAPLIAGFTPAHGSDAGVQKACSFPGGSSGYDPTTVNPLGSFTGGVNGSASPAPDNTQQLCYTLTSVSAPVGSTATFSIDSTTGEINKTAGSFVNGTYTFNALLTDATDPICTSSAGSLTFPCSYSLQFGTPPVPRALCFGATSTMATLNTECVQNTPGAAPGKPLEVFFGASNSVNSGIVGNIGAPFFYVGSGTNTILSDIDTAMAAGNLGYTASATSSNSTNLEYYNVLKRAQTDWSCAPSPTPAFVTGSVNQGVLAIEVKLEKSAFVNPDNLYKTNFTILFRASSSDLWSLATTDSSDPTLAGGVVSNGFDLDAAGNQNILEVSGTGAGSQTKTFLFPGGQDFEYAVRNNGVYGVGCSVCDTCASFTVNFYDAGVGSPQGCPGTLCLGPL